MINVWHDLITLPVSNGLLPRPGGSLTAVFVTSWLFPAILKAGIGADVFLVPIQPEQDPYSVGVIARVQEFWLQDVFVLVNGSPAKTSAVFIRLFGRTHAKAQTFSTAGRMIVASGVQVLDLLGLRPAYPCISGAGWSPQGGSTESRGEDDVRITIHGQDSQSGEAVALQASVGDLITYQQAHTVEHAMIRSLNLLAFCSPKSLRDAASDEARELKASFEAGLRWQMPELFGITQSGACGNPLTNLAKVYLTEEYLDRLAAGIPLLPALEAARRSTLSRLSSDLSLTNEAGLRTLQGLKRGMMHDDTRMSEQLCLRILSRFPVSPWD